MGGAKGKAANKKGRGGRRGGAESGALATRMAGVRGGGRGLERRRGGRGGGAWNVGGAWVEQSVTKKRAGFGVWAGLMAKRRIIRGGEEGGAGLSEERRPIEWRGCKGVGGAWRGIGGGAWNMGGAWTEPSITKERAGLGVWAGLRAKRPIKGGGEEGGAGLRVERWPIGWRGCGGVGGAWRGRGGGAWNVGGAWEEQSITKKRAGLGVWAGLRAKRRIIRGGEEGGAGLREERWPIEWRRCGAVGGAWRGRGGGAWNVGGAWEERSITKERAGLGVWAGLRAKRRPIGDVASVGAGLKSGGQQWRVGLQ